MTTKLLPTLALAALFSATTAMTLPAKEKKDAPDKVCSKSEACEKSAKGAKAGPKGKGEKGGLRGPWKKLELTDEQKEKAKGIMESKKSEFATIQQDAKKKSEAVMDAIEVEMRKILTPKQVADLDAMKKKPKPAKKSE